MKIRLFASDLDGTLLNEKGMISRYSQDTLQALHDSGVIIVIATGRPFYSVQRLFGSSLSTMIDYVISMNGADIYDCQKQSHLENGKPLSSTQIHELIEDGRRYDIGFIELSNTEYSVRYCSWKHAVHLHIYNMARYCYHKMIHKPHTPSEKYNSSIKKLAEQQFDKICYSGDYSSLKLVFDDIRNNGSCSPFFVSSTWLEAMNPSISKGSALAAIQKITGISLQETASIGDGENDLSMFAISGTKIAMENAMEDVKKQADAIADSDVNEGVGKWIEKNLL